MINLFQNWKWHKIDELKKFHHDQSCRLENIIVWTKGGLWGCLLES